MPSSPAPVTDVVQLHELFLRGGRPPAQHRVGTEHEKIGVFSDGSAPSYANAIGPLLAGLAGAGREPIWQRVEEDGFLIGLRRGQATVSLEPGGQVEFSDEPQPSAAAAGAALDAHFDELQAHAEPLGIRWLACGFRPFGTLDDVPWMPKGRYQVMRAYLPTRGRLGHEMMKRTATVQANLDYTDQADCADKVRTAMGVSSLVTALWANSTLVDGRPSGYQSYRAACWLDMDDDRCGLLPFVFSDGAAEHLFRDYTEWALDVPMFFVYRAGHYQPTGGMTFRRFLAEGFHGEQATAGDWDLHLSTLFPEVRLRPHIEVRSADAGSRGMVAALPALYRGLLYDAEARRAAWELVADLDYDERRALRRDVPRAGLQTALRGAPILPLCRELVAIARAGLVRLGDDSALLDVVLTVADEGRTFADRALEAHRQAGGDPRALIDALRL